MTLPILSREELAKASKRESIIAETARQIIKDFGEFNLSINFSGQTEGFYEELFEQMLGYVEQIMAESGNRLETLLYRIDISPKEVALYENQMPMAKPAEVITELIIHRELKKVLTRDYFRNIENSQTSE
jgi:hypothetical protein